MISFAQAIVLGLLQGVTELFPISSLGHSILLPALLGWHFDSNATDVVSFLVATHFATAVVLLGIYWKDWLRIISGIFRSLKEREIRVADTDAKLGWLLIIATIPAGVIGVLFESQAKQLFISPRSAALFLIINGVLLFAAELLRRRKKPTEVIAHADARIARLNWWQAVKIGSMQILALIPGISRTGSTITGGLLNDLSHEDALRFSFLLATPIIGAAALLELPRLFREGGSLLQVALVGAIAAAIAAYGSAKFLVRYFKTRTLTVFASYCITAGVLALFFIR
jgi:undecaprenyl-diphosphatase